jgi:hypothetical protein
MSVPLTPARVMAVFNRSPPKARSKEGGSCDED